MIPIVTLDWESYYATGYSLTNLSTEEYLRHEWFEEIGCAIMLPDEVYPTWYSDPLEIHHRLLDIDWSTHALLCHHGQFDGAILAWHHGIIPRFYLDSMAMGQPTFGFTTGVALSKLMVALGIGEKGTEIVNARGKRRADFTHDELAKYGAYCCNDAWGCKEVFKKLIATTSAKELIAIDENIRCFTDPRIVLDKEMLVEYHQHVVDLKQANYIWAANLLQCEPEQVQDTIMSNEKMALLLQELGVQPPQKWSPTTGKATWAMAKTDDEFKALENHEDERVAALITARLGGKTTIAETRAMTFIGMADRGPMPAYFKYYAAHPGRLGGGDKTNLQNLNKGSPLRDALMAPEKHVLVGGDLSQIEARILVTIAGQEDVVQAFRDYDEGVGPDVYCVTASSFLGRVITKADTNERQLGKVIRLALGYGMGVPRFIITAKGEQYKVTLTPQQASVAHKWFRDTNQYVVRFWESAKTALKKLEQGEEYQFGVDGCIVVKADGIHLPSGRVLRYPGLQSGPSEKFPGQLEWTYMNRKKRVRLYGAKVVENICQSLAGSVCLDAWIEVRHKMKMALQVHDELVAVVHESQAEEACLILRNAMSRTPSWLPRLPVACEVGYAKRFGHIKKT